MSIFKKAQGILGSGGSSEPGKSIGPTQRQRMEELAAQAGLKVDWVNTDTAQQYYRLIKPDGTPVMDEPGRSTSPHPASGAWFTNRTVIDYLENLLGVEDKFDHHPIGRVEWRKSPEGYEVSVGGRHRDMLPHDATDEMLRMKMKELGDRDIEEYHAKRGPAASSEKNVKTASVKAASKSIEEQFADDYNAQKSKIDKLAKAIKLTQSEPKVAEVKTPDGKTKSVFTTTSRDGKPLFVASTDGQNVRQFTNADDVRDFLGQ